MYCHNCGAQLKEGAKFCSVCGQSVENNSLPEQDQIRNAMSASPQAKNPVQHSSVEAPQKQRKSHWYLWIIIPLIAALAFLYLAPVTQNLYVYSSTEFYSSFFSAQDKQNFRELFENKFLFRDSDGEYVLVDVDSGLGGYFSDFRDSMIQDNTDVSLAVTGDYAQIEIDAPFLGKQIVINFTRTSFTDRIRFVYWYYLGF